MRTLFVSPRQCWPATSGAKLRDFHFAKALGHWSDLTYVYLQEQGAEALSPRELPFARQVVAVPRPRGYSIPKLLQGALGPLPLTVINYQSDALFAELEKVSGATQFDICHLDATQLAGSEPTLRRANPHALLVYDWHNIESELLRRYAENTKSPPRRTYAALTASRMESLETKLLQSRAAHVVCSERELHRILGHTPSARAAVVENGVDTRAYEPALQNGSGKRPRKRILFVGSMAYHANADAAVWFARSIWPALHREFPDFTFTIVGANPSSSVIALQEIAGVEVTNTVPDVRPYYLDAFAVVVPLQTGSGTRLKILEAMAAGVPVISTPLGAEGLQVTDGGDILIAKGPDQWLPLLSTLRAPDRWTSLVKSARQRVEARYDWDIVGKRLTDTYSEWLAVDRR